MGGKDDRWSASRTAAAANDVADRVGGNVEALRPHGLPDEGATLLLMLRLALDPRDPDPFLDLRRKARLEPLQCVANVTAFRELGAEQ